MPDGRLVVAGSYNLDMITEVKLLPRPGETVIGSSVSYSHGGKGANQVLAANQFLQGHRESGKGLSFIGAVGQDEAGQRFTRYLQALAIDTTYLHDLPGSRTGMAQILVDQIGENSIVVSPEANYQLTPEDAADSLAGIGDIALLLVQFEIPLKTAIHLIESMKDQKGLVVVNPAPAFPLQDKVFASIDVLTPNLSELALLTGKHDFSDRAEIQQAASELITKGVGHVVVTMGSEGVLYVSGEGSQFFPSNEVKAVDTSGAGDCFNGVFAAALVSGFAMEEAIRQGMLYAALSVTRKGTSISYPDAQEVKSFAEKMLQKESF